MTTPNFVYNETYYLTQNPDVAAVVRAGIYKSGLAHWQAYGQYEGRQASKLFDWQIYRDNNPDLAEAGIVTKEQLTAHFSLYGYKEARVFLSTAVFDWVYYAQQNPDLAAAGITDRAALEDHFKNHGMFEGRIASPLIDGVSYIGQNPDLNALLNAGGNIGGFTNRDTAGIFHYYNYGIYEGRPLGSARDTAPPTALATISHLSDDSGSSTSDFITHTATQTVSGTFTNALGTGETIQVSADGATWVDATTSGNTFSANNVTLSATGATLSVRTVDAGRNVLSGNGHSYTLDTTAPTATVSSATINPSDSVSVKSTEIGTAYLVHNTVNVTNLSAITSATDNKVNLVAITAANTNTNLAATGLIDGIYHVYTVDIAGNLSAASTGSIAVTMPPDTTAPTMSSAAVSTDGLSVVITYSENVTGPAESLDYSIGGYAGQVNGAAIGTGADANKVTLTLSVAIEQGATVSNLSYARMGGATVDSIKDLTGNAQGYQTLVSITNNSTAIVGTTGNDALTGSGSADFIYGLAGNDTITGGAGADTLTGGAGADVFVYTNHADWDASETITDFATSALNAVALTDGALTNIDGDIFLFDLSDLASITGYVALVTTATSGVSTLNVADYVIGNSATAAHAQFLLSGTDTLKFDPDGTGAAAAITVVGHYTYTWLTGTMIAVQA